MKRFSRNIIIFILPALLTSCSLFSKTETEIISHKKTLPVKETKKESVMATYYGGADNFDGKKTASGELFNSKLLTAAHKSLPFGTMLKVTNPKNNKSVVVRINDRGPYSGNCELDLSLEAAKTINLIPESKAMVQLEYLEKSY